MSLEEKADKRDPGGVICQKSLMLNTAQRARLISVNNIEMGKISQHFHGKMFNSMIKQLAVT